MSQPPTDFDVAVKACAELARQARLLVDAVHEDEVNHGGLLSRDTLRKAEELRAKLLEIGA